MELIRNLSLERVCCISQRWLRGCFARRFFAKLIKSQPLLKSALATGNDLEETTKAVDFVESTVGTYSRLFPFKTKEWLECQELKRRLVERKRVTEACTDALQKDPEEHFDELKRVFEEGSAISDSPGTAEQLALFQKISDLYHLIVSRQNCRAEMHRATEAADRRALEEALARAETLDLMGADQMPPAKAMLERCIIEEGICEELQAAQHQGGMLLWGGGQASIDTSGLLAVCAKAKGFGMKTAVGKQQLGMSEYLVRLREAIKKAKDWEGFCEWPELSQLLENPPIGDNEEDLVSFTKHPEICWVSNEMALRSRHRDIHEPLKEGVKSLDEQTLDQFLLYIDTTPFIVSGRDQQERMKALEGSLYQRAQDELARTRNCRVGLESAISSKKEEELKRAVCVATELPVDNDHASGQLEVLVQAKVLLSMLFHIDYGTRAEVGVLLDEKLSSATKATVRGFSSEEEIEVTKAAVDTELAAQTSSLEADLEQASQIELTSEVSGALFGKAQALLALRKCLMVRNWEDLEGFVTAVTSLGMMCAEVRLSKDEMMGRALAKTCLKSLVDAVADVVVPSGDLAHPSEALLEYKLEQAVNLELLVELEEIGAARKMLSHIKSTQKALGESLKLGLDYGHRVESGMLLDDKLTVATVAKIATASSGEEIELKKEDLLAQLSSRAGALADALQQAAEIQLVTRLVEQGKALLALRQCLLAREWGSLGDKLSAAHHAEVIGSELAIAKDEMAGREAAQGCLEKLKIGAAEVANHSDDMTHPSEVVLEARLAQSQQLEMVQELEEIVAAREMLTQIRGIQKDLGEAMLFGVDYGRRMEIGLILNDDLADSAMATVASLSTGEEINITKAEIVAELTSRSDALAAALQHANQIQLVTRLVTRGRALLDLRQCLMSRDWESVEGKLSACLSVKVVGPEINLAKDEMAGRSTAADLLESLSAAVADVATPSDDFDHPSEGVLDSRLAQAERLEMKDLPEIVAAREMLEHIRSTQNHVGEAMKFSIDYGHRVDTGMILDDVLCSATASKIIALSSGTEIVVQKADVLQQLTTQSDSLEAALQRADQIQLSTRLIVQGRALLALRRCLLAQDWEAVEEKLNCTLSTQVVGPETNLAKDEIAGRAKAHDCLEALRVAVGEVATISSEDFGHPSEAPLESRLKQAQQLELQDALPDVTAGRETLEHLRGVRRELEASMKMMDYGRRVEVGLILDDHLCRSTSAKINSLSSGAEIVIQKPDLLHQLNTQSGNLEAALQHASQIQLVTRLVVQGRALLSLRQSLLAQSWEEVEAHLNAAMDLHVGGPETNLAKDEIAGRARAQECLEGLKVAVAEVVNPTEEVAHPSEAALEKKLEQVERLELVEGLAEVVSGREMLERIRATRRELQKGLEVSQFGNGIELAEEFFKLYDLFDESTQQLRKAGEMAKELSYVTQETKAAASLLNEVTILWHLQEDLQEGGYLEGANPTKPPHEVVVMQPITSHYKDYSGFPYVTEIGQYIVRKMYYILMIRSSIQDMCFNPDLIDQILPMAVADAGCPSTPEIVSGELLLNQLNAARASMPQAEETVKEELLIESVKMCDSLFFDNENVQRVRKLKDLVVELNEESRKALWVLDKERMQKVVERADAIGLNTHHLDYTKYLLGLQPMDWLKFEIKKAKELGDNNRKIRLSIEMKDLTLTQFGHLFGLNSLKNMRSPENYASQKLLTIDRKKLAGGMMSFSKTPAHTSLIDFSQLVPQTNPEAHKIVQGLIKDSTRTFKNIMGYMGDKKYPDTISLVQEVVAMCLAQPYLRSEVYLQTLKQITNHPVPANKKRGYELLAVWCWQFPPQPDLDNILETYLRGCVPDRSASYLGRLRDVVFGGVKRETPCGDEIEGFLKAFFQGPARRSRYEEEASPIVDVAYTNEFFVFENQKSLFSLDEEDARLKVE